VFGMGLLPALALPKMPANPAFKRERKDKINKASL